MDDVTRIARGEAGNDDAQTIRTDFENLMRSEQLGIMFLDEGLRLRRFTPAVNNYFDIDDGDIGKPFTELSHLLRYEGLMEDLTEVLENAIIVEREAKTADARMLLMNMAPYWSPEGEVAGLVLSIADLTNIKRLESALKKSYEELRLTISQSSMKLEEEISILVVDDDADDCDIIRRNLHGSHCTVTCANRYDEARELLEDRDFDVCFIDFRLDGGHNGFDLIQSLRPGNPAAFILLSGQVDEVMNEKALALGIYDCVDKVDLTPALLERCIRYTVRHKRTEMYLTQNSAWGWRRY